MPPAWIDVVYSGPDISAFRPSPSGYVYEALQLPRDRKVFIYSGHMEERKGVRTLIDAAIELLHRRGRQDVCFLICGNRPGESRPYEKMYDGLGLDGLIRFAGYRSDIADIFPGCLCGVTPSSGWDSLPRGPLEMASCGLPVIASRLDALPEVVLDRQTGLLFEPGNAKELANRIEELLEHADLAVAYGGRGRQRCETLFNWENQRNTLRDVCLKSMGSASSQMG